MTGRADRDAWCDLFADELIRLRPHTPLKLALTLARIHYDAAKDPMDAARAWHEKNGGVPRG